MSEPQETEASLCPQCAVPMVRASAAVWACHNPMCAIFRESKLSPEAGLDALLIENNRLRASIAEKYEYIDRIMVRATTAEEELRRLRLTGPLSSAWPPRDVVHALVGAVDHLYSAHDCDNQGYEGVMAARRFARAWLAEECGPEILTSSFMCARGTCGCNVTHQTESEEVRAARRMVKADPGENLSDAILRFAVRVVHGHCACRFGEDGKAIDECQFHGLLRKEVEKLRAPPPELWTCACQWKGVNEEARETLQPCEMHRRWAETFTPEGRF